MPLHDWTRVDAGTYHDFHQGWTIELRNALNRGILPEGFAALADQRVEGPEPDIVAYQRMSPAAGPGGLAVKETRPRVRQVGRAQQSDAAAYARKANRIVVRKGRGRVVAVIEILSPGNKETRYALQAFTTKLVEFLHQGINVLLVDPFPPTRRDPDGIHQAIWDELAGTRFEERPADKPLTAAAYDADLDQGITAYVEPLAVGDALPDLPLFLGPGWYVPAPLAASYQASWAETPAFIKEEVEPAAA